MDQPAGVNVCHVLSYLLVLNHVDFKRCCFEVSFVLSACLHEQSLHAGLTGWEKTHFIPIFDTELHSLRVQIHSKGSTMLIWEAFHQPANSKEPGRVDTLCVLMRNKSLFILNGGL